MTKEKVTITMKTSNDPWAGIQVPRSANRYVMRLASEDVNPDGKRVYWARGSLGAPALIVEYNSVDPKPVAVPLFKNIEVGDHRGENAISIELRDQDQKELFLDVCLDIISALQTIPDRAIRKATILRLERWSSFLRPSRAKLSPEAQKGLIAELFFLIRIAFQVYGVDDGLNGWTGPMKAPRDFSFGQIFIEVKSKRGSSNTEVSISSEEQLNLTESERLFLYVVELNSAPVDADNSFSIDDVVNNMKGLIDSPLAIAQLDSKLAEVGYFDEDDYSGVRWTEGEDKCYEILDGFPRITSGDCPPGVCNVTYHIDLDYCEDYRLDLDEFVSILR